jgi:hypothetical protein
MKRVSIGFSTLERVLTIVFMFVFILIWGTQFFVFLSKSNSSVIQAHYNSIFSSFLLSNLPVLFAFLIGIYFSGISINLYDDRIEYTWYQKVTKIMPLNQTEIHVYRFFFKDYVAIYDKRNNKLYKVYSKQSTKKFVTYVKTNHLAIVHDSYRYFTGYMKTNHPGYKQSF